MGLAGGWIEVASIVLPPGEVVVSMRPVRVFANSPDSEIERLRAELRGRWRQAARAVMVLLSVQGLPAGADSPTWLPSGPPSSRPFQAPPRRRTVTPGPILPALPRPHPPGSATASGSPSSPRQQDGLRGEVPLMRVFSAQPSSEPSGHLSVHWALRRLMPLRAGGLLTSLSLYGRRLLLTYVDSNALTSEKYGELLASSPARAWTACASIWSRVFVLSAPGWRRYTQISEKILDAYSLAMHRSIGISAPLSVESLLSAFEAFDIEDDGSAEWSYTIDLIEMLSAAIGGENVSACLETALRVYPTETFNALTRAYAIADGKPISYAEAKTRVADDVTWRRTLDLISAL
jgi:hypothetical protein